jgi:hypothetical protein
MIHRNSTFLRCATLELSKSAKVCCDFHVQFRDGEFCADGRQFRYVSKQQPHLEKKKKKKKKNTHSNPMLLCRSVDVRAGTIGVLNPEASPMLAGFLMAFHKGGYFFIFIATLGKMVAVDMAWLQQTQANSLSAHSASATGISHSFVYFFWQLLALKSIVLLLTFQISFYIYKDYLTCFIMAIVTSIITLCFGLFLFFFKFRETVIRPLFHRFGILR